jgi:hypothetical protein
MAAAFEFSEFRNELPMGELRPHKKTRCPTSLSESASCSSSQISSLNEMVSATGVIPMKLSETKPYRE